MIEPDHLRALVGGVLIGTASLLAAGATGKVPGISGMLSRALQGAAGDRAWRWLFLAGLVSGAVATFVFIPATVSYRSIGTWPVLAVAGLLVGIGTRLGGGCTSGHGVCGLGAGSKSSLVAVGVFMVTGAIVVAVVNAFGRTP